MHLRINICIHTIWCQLSPLPIFSKVYKSLVIYSYFTFAFPIFTLKKQSFNHCSSFRRDRFAQTRIYLLRSSLHPRTLSVFLSLPLSSFAFLCPSFKISLPFFLAQLFICFIEFWWVWCLIVYMTVWFVVLFSAYHFLLVFALIWVWVGFLIWLSGHVLSVLGLKVMYICISI